MRRLPGPAYIHPHAYINMHARLVEDVMCVCVRERRTWTEIRNILKLYHPPLPECLYIL